MTEYVTKEDLSTILEASLTRFSATINDRIDGFESQVNKRFDAIDQRFVGVDKRFVAIETRLEGLEQDMSKVKHVLLDYIGTDRAVHNLVRELQDKGIAIEDSKVFAV